MVRFPVNATDFLYLFPSVLLALELTQSIQCVMGYVPQGVKRPGCESDHIQLISKMSGARPPSLRLWFYDVHGEN